MDVVTELSLVDQLGQLDKQIKALTKQSEAIKAQIKAQGIGEHLGQEYRALVIQSEPATRTDWQAIAERFNPSRQLIAAHSTVGSPIVSIRITKVD